MPAIPAAREIFLANEYKVQIIFGRRRPLQ
jgi:hypothetical protein